MRFWISFPAVDSDRHGRRLPKSLIHHTVALGQPAERFQLICRGVGIKIEAEPDILKTDGRLFGYAQRPAEIQVSFGSHRTPAQDYTDRGGHGR